jgi:threonine dehydratase
VEPTGVLGFAAAVNQRESLRGKRVGIVLSGGNIDPALLSEILA